MESTVLIYIIQRPTIQVATGPVCAHERYAATLYWTKKPKDLSKKLADKLKRDGNDVLAFDDPVKVPVIAKPISNIYRKYIHNQVSTRIRTDYYWHKLGDKIIRGDGPTAVCFRIGYFLSSPLPVPTLWMSQQPIYQKQQSLHDSGRKNRWLFR